VTRSLLGLVWGSRREKSPCVNAKGWGASSDLRQGGTSQGEVVTRLASLPAGCSLEWENLVFSEKLPFQTAFHDPLVVVRSGVGGGDGNWFAKGMPIV
jgi:hypothetical protein